MSENPFCPTQAGFLWFLRNIVSVPQAALPDDAGVISWVYLRASQIVLPVMQCVDPSGYTQAVYNLGADLLINWAQDQPGQVYFANARTKYNCGKFRGGVVASAADEGTSTSLNVIEALNTLTVADLQNLNTPYGQAYIGFAQQFGTVWGMS